MTGGDSVNPEGVEVLRAEVRHIKESMNEVRDTLRSINAAVHALVRVEQQQVEHRESIARAHDTLEKHDGRLMSLEVNQPSLLLTRNWVLAAVVAVFAFSFWAIATGHLVVAKVPA